MKSKASRVIASTHFIGYMLTGYLTAHFAQIINACKNIGYVGGAVTFALFIFKGIRSGYRTVKSTNDNVTLLMTNHMPHIQRSIDEHSDTLLSIQSDVRDMGTKLSGYNTRLDDTKNAVHSLGTAFLQHVENASKEKEPVPVFVPVKSRSGSRRRR